MRRLAHLAENDDENGDAENGDEGNGPPSEDDLRTNIVVQDAERGRGYAAWHEGKEIAAEDDWDDLMKAINAWMKKEQFFPSVYFVNERGNIETLDPKTGNIIGQGWV